MISPAKAAEPKSAKVFTRILVHSRTVLALGLLAIVLGAVLALDLTQDTSSNAFLAERNPALLYSEKIKQQFGLSDPIIVAVVAEREGGIYRPDTLKLIDSLTRGISALDNIDSNHLLSLATAKNIRATGEGMEVSPFLETMPASAAAARQIQREVNDFPLYVGSLASENGVAAMIVAELVDGREAGASYQQILSLVAAAPVPTGVDVHVAGEVALSGYLGSYIEADARRLNPLAWLIITVIILLAFWRLSPALMANVVIAASILITLGTMAGTGIPFYIITSALPAILIGISVADSIHIYALYFEKQVQQPQLSPQELIVATMSEIWRPITLTTLTTMAGFLGLYFAAYMPPFKYFGLFAALGVFIAWLYSMVFLPAALKHTGPRASASFIRLRTPRNAPPGLAPSASGGLVLRRPALIVALFAMVTLFGAYSASQLQVGEDPVEILHPSEPLYRADRAINQHLNGTNPLDIVIETPAPEDLFEPANLRKIEALQNFAGTLPHVRGSVSYVDYLKQMNRSLNGGAAEFYRLPDSREMVAQFFMVYSATSDPTDFEEEIDYDYQVANVRLTLDTTSYREIRAVVEPLQDYVQEHFSSEEISATLSGRVSLNYYWIHDLARSHFAGLLVALILVWSVATLLLGSALAGIYTLIPVAGSVLFIYAAMVILGIDLGVGTSMFAAVAIGLGVDFSIHTLDRLRILLLEYHSDFDRAYNDFYRTTGLALGVNFLAISCGFAVLITSEVSSLNNFGAILVVSVTASFISSITVLPAMVKLFRPGFVVAPNRLGSGGKKTLLLNYVLVALVMLAGYLLMPRVVAAQTDATRATDPNEAFAREALVVPARQLTAMEIVERVNGVSGGEFVSRGLRMTLTNRSGKERTRETVNYRKVYADGKRTVMFYLAPATIRDTAFLIWDYTDPGKDDDQWLYLPALRKVRRVSAAARGDYFLGTDFTYEDIKLDGKLSPDDYQFTLLGSDHSAQVDFLKLQAVPKSEEIASELGYSKVVSWVDPHTWMITRAEFWDTKERLLKSLTVTDISKIGGIMSRNELLMINHQTGHQTHFQFLNVDYETPVDDDLFTRRALERGL